MLNLKKLWNRLTKRGSNKKTDGDATKAVAASGKRRTKRFLDESHNTTGPWRMPRKPARARRACINRRFWMRIRARQPLEVPVVSARRALLGLRVCWPLRGRPKPARLARLKAMGRKAKGVAA